MPRWAATNSATTTPMTASGIEIFLPPKISRRGGGRRGCGEDEQDRVEGGPHVLGDEGARGPEPPRDCGGGWQQHRLDPERGDGDLPDDQDAQRPRDGPEERALLHDVCPASIEWRSSPT